MAFLTHLTRCTFAARMWHAATGPPSTLCLHVYPSPTLPLLRLMFQFKCHKMSQRSQLTSVLCAPLRHSCSASSLPSPSSISTDLGAGFKMCPNSRAAKSNTLGGKQKKKLNKNKIQLNSFVSTVLTLLSLLLLLLLGCVHFLGIKTLLDCKLNAIAQLKSAGQKGETFCRY